MEDCMGHCITGASTFQLNWGLNQLLQETVYTYLCHLVICVHVVLKLRYKQTVKVGYLNCRLWGQTQYFTSTHTVTATVLLYRLLSVPHGFLK